MIESLVTPPFTLLARVDRQNWIYGANPSVLSGQSPRSSTCVPPNWDEPSSYCDVISDSALAVGPTIPDDYLVSRSLPARRSPPPRVTNWTCHILIWIRPIPQRLPTLHSLSAAATRGPPLSSKTPSSDGALNQGIFARPLLDWRVSQPAYHALWMTLAGDLLLPRIHHLFAPLRVRFRGSCTRHEPHRLPHSTKQRFGSLSRWHMSRAHNHDWKTRTPQ